jgi:hypothetical protein
MCGFFNKSYHPIPWRDSTSRPIAPQAEKIPLDHAARAGWRFVLILRMNNFPKSFLPKWSFVTSIPGLTDARVAVVAEVVAVPAVALEHVVVDVEADLRARVPIFAAA